MKTKMASSLSRCPSRVSSRFLWRLPSQRHVGRFAARSIRENKEYKLGDILKGLRPLEAPILEGMEGEIIFTGTARAALRIILDFLKTKGLIKNKNTQVLVPQWLCLSVYHTMHKVCFPVLTTNENVRGVLIYHQYGFPQNMDAIMKTAQGKKWFVIENCANVYKSFYKGKGLGTFGLASIFSFSKMFPSIQGGALVSQDKQLIKFAKEALIKKNDRWIAFMAHLARILSEKTNSVFWNKIQEMVYAKVDSAKTASALSLNLVRRDLLNKAIEKRKANYQFLLTHLKEFDFFKGLEKESVIPYVVPLITKEKRLMKIKNALLSLGVWTDIYHFDINRNLLNPKFVKCLWIPVHQGLTTSKMFKICETIKKPFDEEK